MRFPIGVVARTLLGVSLPVFLYLMFETAKDARQSGEWWLPLISLAILAINLFADPGEIRVNPKGIILTRFFGLQRKRIEWLGAEARNYPGLREVLVIGSDGTAITHSQYHVGHDQFLVLLKRYGIKVQ